MRHGQRFIGSARREIDDEVVQFTPFNIADELLDGPEFDGPTPNDRGVFIFQEERHADDFHTEVALSGMDALVLDVKATPVQSHHLGNIRAGDIDVENTHGVALLSQGKSQSS